MEPWYESQTITKAEVERVIQQGWFHRELHSDSRTRNNSIDPDKQLCRLLYQDERMLSRPYRSVTFEAIKRHSNWQDQARLILSAEMDKMGSFGSHRGYYTFCHRPLMEAYAKGVVRECWAKPILAKFARQWLEHHYAYGNDGFLNAKTNFVVLASR